MNNPDFLIIPYQVIADPELRPTDRVLYGVIYWLVKLKNEKCYASNRTLAELCQVESERAVRAGLERLEKQGYVKRVFHEKPGKSRDEIIPLIAYGKVGTNEPTPGTNVSADPGTNVPQSNKTNNNKTLVISSATPSVAENKAFADLMDKFKAVNPTTYKLFGNKTQRKALQNLIDQFGYEKVEKMIVALPEIITQPYAPVITTPVQLERDLAKLFAFVRKQQTKQPKFVSI